MRPYFIIPFITLAIPLLVLFLVGLISVWRKNHCRQTYSASHRNTGKMPMIRILLIAFPLVLAIALFFWFVGKDYLTSRIQTFAIKQEVGTQGRTGEKNSEYWLRLIIPPELTAKYPNLTNDLFPADMVKNDKELLEMRSYCKVWINNVLINGTNYYTYEKKKNAGRWSASYLPNAGGKFTPDFISGESLAKPLVIRGVLGTSLDQGAIIVPFIFARFD